MILVDTHCHLYLDEFKTDIHEVMMRAQDADVKYFYLPAIDSTTHTQMNEFEDNYPGKCFSMMGLHPCSVKGNVNDELDVVEKWLGTRKYAAIGEIGLDFYWDKSFMNDQYLAFNRQMQWALDLSMPIVIHTRNAMDETIKAVEPFAKKGLKGIFHCFGDSLQKAQAIVSMGFYLGIGGVLTYKKSGLGETLKNINIQSIVLETDAPYLSPVPYRGKRNESSYIKHIAAELALVKDISLEEVAAITTANAEKVLAHW